MAMSATFWVGMQAALRYGWQDFARPLIANYVDMLAAEIGTVSETLSRTFADFRERKLVRVAGKAITILDAKRLEQVLRRNLGEL